MRKTVSSILCSVHPSVYIVLALSILLLPFRWVLAWTAATVFHEFCHYAALKLCGCGLDEIRFGLNGAVMEAEALEWKRQLLCTLAGPVGSLLLVLFGKWFPEVAVCAFVQSVYNLLPILPMDGGRAIECIFQRAFSVQTARKLQKITQSAALTALGAAGLYAAVYMKLGVIPIIAFLLLCWKNRKTPCKAEALRVQ